MISPDSAIGLENKTRQPVRRWRKRIWVPVFVLLTLPLLVLDLSPSVEKPPPPTAAQVLTARALFSHVRYNAGKAEPRPVAVSWAELEAASAVANHLLGNRRAALAHDQAMIRVSASQPLPLGLWINAEAHVPHSPNGVPLVTGWIGRIPVPNWMAQGMIRIGRWYAGRKGIEIPPPEKLLSSVQLTQQGVVASLAMPKDASRLAGLVSGRLAPLSSSLVADHYCRLVASLKDAPAPAFIDLVRRSFELSKGTSIDDHRAAIVVLPMLIVSRRAGDLVGDAATRTRACAMAPYDPVLDGRADLAKHWALSAALTATVGSDVSAAMGTWKEIADSGPEGTGFSFVDLAADRSGIQFMRALLDETSADATRDRLRHASEADVLPIAALALAEGMTEAEFKQRYKSIESARYTAVLARIDERLAERLGRAAE